MKSHRYSLAKINTLPSKKIFFDANVLIYIFWPTMPGYVSAYSSAFRGLLNVKFTLITSAFVISEVINTCLRLEYNKYLKASRLDESNCPFKEFRESETGKSIQRDVYTIVKDQILQFIDIHDSQYSNVILKSLLVVDTLDFNDKLILSCCRSEQCILFTNDKDFKNEAIDILTNNSALLS
jgi:predicted nucleic acid-binding protein